MSKLFNEYKILKNKNPNKTYLFKSGLFYIFLDNDAKTVSETLGLKLTNLNPTVQKCGFPENSFVKYYNLLDKLNFDIEVVSNISNEILVSNIDNYYLNNNLQNVITDFLKIDINELSIQDAFDCLIKLQNNLKTFGSDCFEKIQ